LKTRILAFWWTGIAVQREPLLLSWRQKSVLTAGFFRHGTSPVNYWYMASHACTRLHIFQPYIRFLTEGCVHFVSQRLRGDKIGITGLNLEWRRCVNTENMIICLTSR
jgi:hypothetical protein